MIGQFKGRLVISCQHGIFGTQMLEGCPPPDKAKHWASTVMSRYMRDVVAQCDARMKRQRIRKTRKTDEIINRLTAGVYQGADKMDSFSPR